MDCEPGLVLHVLWPKISIHGDTIHTVGAILFGTLKIVLLPLKRQTDDFFLRIALFAEGSEGCH